MSGTLNRFLTGYFQLLSTQKKDKSSLSLDAFKQIEINENETNSYKDINVSSIVPNVLALSWCFGLNVLSKPSDLSSAHLVRLSLLPTPFPKHCFNLACELSPAYTRLITKLTMNSQWLYSILKKVSDFDKEFTARILQIAQKVYGTDSHQRDIQQDILLIIIRADYMADMRPKTKTLQLQQVELNTISLSFAALAQKLTCLHKNVLSHTLKSKTKHLNMNSLVPDNNAFASIIQAFTKVHELYCKRYNNVTSDDILGQCVLFVVRELETNSIDQHHIHSQLLENGITCFFYTFKELYSLYKQTKSEREPLGLHIRESIDAEQKKLLQTIRLTEPRKGRLFLPDPFSNNYWEIFLVYYRTAYDPLDYIAEGSWIIREVLEMSDAVKCPNVFTHLAGVKKIQEKLASEQNELEKFIDDSNLCRSLLEASARQVDVTDIQETRVKELINEAIQEPTRFVLKPQREGGMHNLYDQELKTTLETIIKSSLEERNEIFSKCGGYILMERFQPPTQATASIQTYSDSNLVTVQECVSELGIFGINITDARNEIINVSAGYLLRSKASHSVEGGIAVGSGFLDTPLLLEDQTFL